MTKNIDYKKIMREFCKLGVPKEYQIPPILEMAYSSYIIQCSERRMAKTTNWLLVGLCMNKLYGSVVQYVRQTEDMTRKSNIEKLVEVINSNVHYIDKLTNSEYNHIGYKYMNKCFVYEKIENDKVIAESKEIIHILSVDKSEIYKSGYNAPNGDIIIYDEFISRRYRYGEVMDFLNIVSTIARERTDVSIVMLANTINRNSDYFEEFNIRKIVNSMHRGEHKRIQTPKGTIVYFELMGGEVSEKKKILNARYFGFGSESMASLTGEYDWCYASYLRIPKKEEQEKIISRDISLEIIKGEYIAIDICENGDLYVHRIFNPRGIIATNDRSVGGKVYGLINDNFRKFIFDAIKENRIYFSTMECGSDFFGYISKIDDYKRQI